MKGADVQKESELRDQVAQMEGEIKDFPTPLKSETHRTEILLAIPVMLTLSSLSQ